MRFLLSTLSELKWMKQVSKKVEKRESNPTKREKSRKFGRVWSWKFPYFSLLEITSVRTVEARSLFHHFPKQLLPSARQFPADGLSKSLRTWPVMRLPSYIPHLCTPISRVGGPSQYTSSAVLDYAGSQEQHRPGIDQSWHSDWMCRLWHKLPKPKFRVQHLSARWPEASYLSSWPWFPYLKMNAMLLLSTVIGTYE